MTDVAYRLQFTAKEAPVVHVVSFRGRERLSKPYQFVVTGFSEDVFPAQLLVGKSCALTMTPGRETESRVVHGFVSRARVSPNTRMGRGVDVELRLSSRLFELGLGRTSRIFQDLSVPEIAAQVLNGARLPNRSKLALEHIARPYCVQYAESDLEFVQRILADEGLYYYFENVEDRAGLVLCDHASHMDASPEERLEFRPGVGLGRRANEVGGIAGVARTRADTVTVRARDFTRPLIDLPASAVSAGDGEVASIRRRYEHDEDWSAGRTVESSSRVRLEQHRRNARVAEGHSGSVRLAPGRRFQLDGAQDELGTNDVAMVWVEHTGFHPEAAAAAGHDASTNQERPVYENRFGCVDGAVAYRPKRPARRIQQVLETATVVGPPGEEIHTDEHGRVKVRFHWDEQATGDDRSSCWIRPAQPWAGAGYGFQFIPRVGMEVVVGFLGGDPDRPLLLGSTYNGAMRPPHPLPAEKTRSGIRTASSPGSGGHNELAFEDALGKEQVYLHAERDFDAKVGRNHTVAIGGSELVEIDESRVLQVKMNHERTVMGDEAATVGGSSVSRIMGRHVITVHGQGGAGESPEVDTVARGGEDTFQSAEAGANALPSSPDATMPASPSPRTPEGARALIGWFVEQLPEEAYPIGRLLEQRIEWFEDRLSTAEKGRAALTPTLEDLIREGVRGVIGPDPEQLEVTKQAVKRARSRAEEALAALRTEVTTFPFEKKDFAAIAPVLQERIKTAAASATNVVAWSSHVEGAIQSLTDGGGALEPAQAQRFQELLRYAPPDPVAWDSGQLAFTKQAAAKPVGERAYRLEIQGGGEILSNDGFTIRVGESVIDMTKDTISIYAPKVRVDGKPILMNCPKPPEPVS